MEEVGEILIIVNVLSVSNHITPIDCGVIYKL